MYAALGRSWGNSLLGFIALATVPLPFLIKYGEAILTLRGFRSTVGGRVTVATGFYVDRE